MQSSHISRISDLNNIINEFMNQAKQALSHIITSIQSDQLLQQMRNDPHLYQQKIQYIKQIIKEHFIFNSIDNDLFNEIQELKRQKIQLQNKINDVKDDYLNQLSNIQIQYKQFSLEKENQKIKLKTEIEEKCLQNQKIKKINSQNIIKIHQFEQVTERLMKQLQIIKNKQKIMKNNLTELQGQRQNLLEEIKLIKKQNIDQKQTKKLNSNKFSQLQQDNTKLKQQNTKITQQLQNCKIKLHNLQIQYAQTIQSNQLLTIKMKQDMFLIKQQWQKRCQSIQQQLQQDYHNKILEHEHMMNDKIHDYINEMKLGKNIIIQSSEEILESKRIMMEEKYRAQVTKYEESLNQEVNRGRELEGGLEEMRKIIEGKEKQLIEMKKYYQGQIKSKQERIDKIDNEFTSKIQKLISQSKKIKQQSQKQIDRLRKTQNMLLKDLQAHKKQKQTFQKQLILIRQQFDQYKQKQLKQSKRMKELEEMNRQSEGKIIELRKDVVVLGEKLSINQKVIKEKNGEINRLEGMVENVKNQYKNVDMVGRKMELKLAEMNLKVKELERQKEEQNQKVHKLHILVRKLSKELTLLKEDILFVINIEKTKLNTLIMTLNQQILKNQESLNLKYKLKVKQLLDELQKQRRIQNHQYDILQRENQNMKKEIKILQKVMQDKQQEYVFTRERVVNLEVEKCRLLMQEEINKEREERRKLEEKLYNQEKRQEYLVNKAEKQVAKNVRVFMAKWESQIAEFQETLQFKQKHLKQTTQHLKKLLGQIQSVKQNLTLTQEKLTKQQRKYESLKQQRDRTIDEMMKRLQKETKHKLGLEKELKQIRGELMKTQSNSYSPFNNYSFTDRENTGVYTNVFQATTHEKVKTQVKNNREKELSEIREMIAKTYKVVEGAEKDSPMTKGKLF